MGKIIALIPTYGERPYLAEMLKWLDKSKEIDDVIVYKQDIPIGLSNARIEVINKAYSEYGSDNYYLMLDDDCIFSENTKILDTTRYFEKYPELGIIQFPTDVRKVPSLMEVKFAYHCFMFKGSLIEEGINYCPDEFCDEVSFSFLAYLLGYRIFITDEAEIWHHFSNTHEDSSKDSATSEYVKKGILKYKNTFMEKMSGKYLNFSYVKHNGMLVPNHFSIKETQLAIDTHNKNLDLRI